jgi:hypothetical protein
MLPITHRLTIATLLDGGPWENDQKHGRPALAAISLVGAPLYWFMPRGPITARDLSFLRHPAIRTT